MTYSYKKLSASKLETIRELQSVKTEYSQTDDVSVTKDRSLFEQKPRMRKAMTDSRG
jgi:hypothetical protein